MRQLLRAVANGFGRGRSLLPAGVLLWLGALALAWVAGAPIAATLHGALDRHPGAARLISDGGIQVAAELGRSSPVLWPAALAAIPPLLLLFLPLSVLLVAGTYALAAGESGRPWATFWTAGARRFGSFTVVAALGAVYAAAVAAVASGACAAIAAGARAVGGRGVYWTGASLRAAVILLAALHARSVLGFALASREVRPEEKLLHGFLRSLRFCWRRPGGTVGLGAALVALQVLCAAAGLALAGAAGAGGWLAAAAAQAGFLGASWLRAIEIRARIAYLSGAEPAPAPPRAITEPLASPPLVDTTPQELEAPEASA